MQVSPQNPKGKSNMVYDDEFKRHPGTDKWMVSIVIEQGKYTNILTIHIYIFLMSKNFNSNKLIIIYRTNIIKIRI